MVDCVQMNNYYGQIKIKVLKKVNCSRALKIWSYKQTFTDESNFGIK